MKNNKLLIASVILNVAALTLVFSFVVHRSNPTPNQASQPSIEKKSASIAETSKPEPAHSITWQEIASTDYPDYISHLRALGCPERTIRWIIASEISIGNQSQSAAQLQDQPNDGASLANNQQEQIQKLLGTPISSDGKSATASGADTNVPPTEAGDVSSSPSSSVPTLLAKNSVNNALQPLVPLAFFMQPEGGDQSNGGVQIDPSQQTAVQSLQQSFSNQVGGTNQNPSNPAYSTNWTAAQELSDEIFRSQFGYQAYNQLIQQQTNELGSRQ